MPHSRRSRVLIPLAFCLAASQGQAQLEAHASQQVTQSGEPLLACRLASYGPYQQSAWSHLPTLGVRHIFMSIPTLTEVPALEARLAEAQLRVVVFRGDLNLAHADCISRLESQLAICKRMGVRYLFVSPKHEGISMEAACDRLREAGMRAREHGVTISLETHPDLGTNGSVQLETMKRVNHPNVRVNFDTGNITYYNENTNAVAELRKILPYVATVELKDHDGKLKSWFFPALGKGRVDLEGVIAVLRSAGFQGPLTVEVEGVANQPWDERQTKQAIADSVAYLRVLGLKP